MTKVLVIEDEKPVLNNILKLLQLEDFEAIGAENGLLGVKLAIEQLPDLIICDVMMPELDGYGVLIALRQNPETAIIPFIFLTAKASKADLRQGMQLGADDYVTKPFTNSELLQGIATRLEKQAAIARQAQKKMDELRSSITESLSLELRNPLNKIINLSEDLISECDSIEALEILEKGESINKSAKQLQKRIKNSLIFEKLKKMVMDKELIKTLRKHRINYPQAVIADVVYKKAQEVARETDLDLNLQEGVVNISELKLKKIVEELIDNAFKFSKEGTRVRVIGTYDSNKFILYVVDYGRGMTAEQIASVETSTQFESGVEEQQSYGLGLAIAKILAQLHGGSLTIESIPNKQTTVALILPM